MSIPIQICPAEEHSPLRLHWQKITITSQDIAGPLNLNPFKFQALLIIYKSLFNIKLFFCIFFCSDCHIWPFNDFFSWLNVLLASFLLSRGKVCFKQILNSLHWSTCSIQQTYSMITHSFTFALHLANQFTSISNEANII